MRSPGCVRGKSNSKIFKFFSHIVSIDNDLSIGDDTSDVINMAGGPQSHGGPIILWHQVGKAGCLARDPRCTRCSLFCWQTQPMVYAPSHTQSGYIHNLRVSLANRWPLALLSYWCTAPVPGALKHHACMTRQAQPVCKYILCIYQDNYSTVGN